MRDEISLMELLPKLHSNCASPDWSSAITEVLDWDGSSRQTLGNPNERWGSFSESTRVRTPAGSSTHTLVSSTVYTDGLFIFPFTSMNK